MIFLIGKIFIYLLVAGLVGALAGWLVRNLQAQRTEESAQRAAHDAKAKLPQLESLLRARDEQVTKLKGMLTEKKAEFAGYEQKMRDMEQQMRELEREARRWQERAEARQGDDLHDIDMQGDRTGDADGLIAELSREITRLKDELAAAGAGTGVTRADHLQVVDAAEVEQLRARLAEAERELELAKADLLDEQNKVLELERERELQNKSLQVLYQQLDLERTRRAANG